MDVVADLHAHTTASDGELTLSAVPDAARAAGLDCVALTDHDRYHPGLSDPVTTLDGVTVVRGIELRVGTDAGRLDLLGYGLRETAALAGEVERLQRDRVERARAMVDCVEDRLGVDLDVEFERGVGRPHVARAVARSGADLGYEGAFERLIGSDGPCFRARDVPAFERGVRLLRKACALVGLAHPLRCADPASALERAAGLDAVELHYPYDRAPDPSTVDPAAVERAVRRHDLLATGGSDAHDRALGTAGLDAAAWAPVRERLPVPGTQG